MSNINEACWILELITVKTGHMTGFRLNVTKVKLILGYFNKLAFSNTAYAFFSYSQPPLCPSHRGNSQV